MVSYGSTRDRMENTVCLKGGRTNKHTDTASVCLFVWVIGESTKTKTTNQLGVYLCIHIMFSIKYSIVVKSYFIKYEGNRQSKRLGWIHFLFAIYIIVS